MTYDYEIELIQDDGESVVNEIGDMAGTETERTVLAGILDYRSKDFYQALASGLKPSITFAVSQYEYEGEKTIRHKGRPYRVIDVAPVKAKDESEFESLALLCEAVI